MKTNGNKPKSRGRSSTRDVLGIIGPARKVGSKWGRHHQELTEVRDRLLNTRQNHSEEAREELSSFSLHMADAGTDSYDRDWALAVASSNQTVLYEIDQALQRIQNGTYGVCEWTGEPIESERLKAVPWARFSAKAQAELEQRGAAGRTQLGELGSYAHAMEMAFHDGARETQPEPDEEREAA